jgi:hypothetical protein
MPRARGGIITCDGQSGYPRVGEKYFRFNFSFTRLLYFLA